MMKTRQFMRVPVPMPARVRVAGDSDELIPATILDISWGGVLAKIDPPPEKGQRVMVEFLMSDESVSLELWGKVVREAIDDEKYKGGVGIEFESLDEDSRSLIQRIVNEEVEALIKRD